MENLNAYDDMEKALDESGVVLTTPVVSKILQRLQYEEKTAFRFFTWAGHREHYSHEPSTYNEMIDILSSTKYKNKQFRIVIDMLDYKKRNNKTAVPTDVLIEILRKYCERYLTHVQKFAKRKRIRVKTQPEINAFNMLIDALCKCGLVKEAETMVKRIRYKVKPDANTFNVLFFGSCRVRDPKKAMKLLDEMIQAGHKPENFTYCAAIDAFCQAGMVDDAAELFDFMVTKGSAVSAPTAKTFALMIVALAKNDKAKECSELKEVVNKGLKLPYRAFDSFLMRLSEVGNIKAIHKVSEHMKKFYNHSMARRFALSEKRKSTKLRGK